jgi:hypothetical protein
MTFLQNFSVDVNLTMGMNATAEETLSPDFRGRFIAYSVLAALGLAFNVLSFAALCHMRGHRTVHHVCLLNLAACDMLGTVLLWMYYNAPYMFPKFEMTRLEHCMFTGLVLVGPFLLSLCSSCLALLLLAFNQYMAICHPLFTTTRISRGTILCCIIVCWVVTVLLASLPALLMLALNTLEGCAQYAQRIGVTAIEVSTHVLTGLLVLIIALYARIYHEVRQYRKRMPQLQIRRLRAEPPSTGKLFPHCCSLVTVLFQVVEVTQSTTSRRSSQPSYCQERSSSSGFPSWCFTSSRSTWITTSCPTPCST